MNGAIMKLQLLEKHTVSLQVQYLQVLCTIKLKLILPRSLSQNIFGREERRHQHFNAYRIMNQ
jgi:hypothetical protein